MSLLNFLSAAGTTATNAASAYQGAKANVAEKQRDQEFQQMMLQQKLLKEKHDQESMDAFRRAQISHLGSQTEGQWGQAFAGEDDQGPGMFQQHKTTGEVRRAQIGSRMPSVGAAPATVSSERPDHVPEPDPFPQGTPPQQPPAKLGSFVRPPAKIIPPDPTKVHAANREFDVKHPLPVTPNNVYLSTVGPDGKPTYGVGQSKGDPTIRPTDVQKPATGTGAGSAVNVAATARIASGVSQMENAHQFMKQYEAKLRSGEASINGLDQFLKQTGTAFSHNNPLSNAAMSASLAWLGYKNPELARYVRRGLEYAQGESQITNRPSDFRVKLSDFLASAQTGDFIKSPALLDDVENTREAILSPLRQFVQQQPGTGGRGGGGTPSKITPAERKALKDSGFTDAQINAKYGPP